MESERLATILGFIIAVAVLAAACVYVPPGSAVKLSAQTVACAPTTPVAAAPATTPAAPKGPVIRDVPQQ